MEAPNPMRERRISTIFSWEVYPRKIPKSPKPLKMERLRAVLILMVCIELLLASALFMIPFTSGYVDDVDISGKYVDGSGKPIPGASIMVDTGQWGVTNWLGEFIIEDVESGPRTLTFSSGGIVHKHEFFVAPYYNNQLTIQEGSAPRNIPGTITMWNHLNGLFFGVATIMFIFAMTALLAYGNMKKPSIAFSACAMALLGAGLVMTTTMWMDIAAVVLFLMGLWGLFLAYVMMKRKRTYTLTSQSQINS